jgi:hypothetical protein
MRTLPTLVAASLLVCAVSAQGPDVIVGDINGVSSYGNSGSIYAYSVGTTSCNIGNVWLDWIAGSNRHPVIGQAFYRLKPVTGTNYSRFEQIGFSWLKHGFFALSGGLCFNDCNATDGSHLGVHCSDPYGSDLNGSQGNGPRNEVNASTGYFPYPYSGSYPNPTTVIDRRIQCQLADVAPAQNAGATYWAEGHYVTPDDAASGNKNNNASARRIAFASDATVSATFVGPTVQQQPAITQWQVFDPFVSIANVDIPNDGRFIVAKRVWSYGGGLYHFEFAVHNLSSDRAGAGFTVNFAPGVTLSNPGFKSVPYHSGEPYSNAPWTSAINGNQISWSNQASFQTQPNANALRFGTTYNFWLDATVNADVGEAISLFKPEACATDPVVTPAQSYVLNAAAPYDDPSLTAPTPGPSGDDTSVTVPIGFSFTFYGATYTNVNVCTNGFLNFGPLDSQYANACLPTPLGAGAVIAAYWDDLITPPGSITYQTIGSAPNRRFVASWNSVGLYANPSSPHTFKVILDETTNKITSTIVSCTDGGASATRGVQRADGLAGVLASCDVPGSAPAATSQTYTPVTSLLPSATLTVTGSTGPNGVLTWSINSVARSAPVILVASLDPGPINLGPLGVIGVGLVPGLYVVLADGIGAFGPQSQADVTDWYCGDFQLSVPLGPAGLPPGIPIYNQGVIVAPASVPPPPNGQFHLTTPVTITT